MDKTINSLNKIIKFPSDLDTKLDVVIKKIQSRITKLDSEYKGQVLRGTKNIEKNFEDLKRVKENYSEYRRCIKEIVNLQNRFSGFIRDFDKIKILSLAHMNFEKIVNFSKKLDSDFEIDEDLWKGYREFVPLDNFRLELKYFMDNVDRETFLGLQSTISKLENLSLKIEHRILTICMNYSTDLVAHLNTICKIVNEESERDNLTKSIKERKNVYDQTLTEMYPYYQKREIGNLSEKIRNTVIDSVHLKFNKIGENNFYVENLEFVFEELQVLHELIKIPFLSSIFMEYHLSIKKLLEEKKKKMDAGEILGVLEFVRRYTDILEQMKQYEILSKPLIDNEHEYLEQYLKVVSERLHEWIQNISVAERDKFLLREVKPEEDEDKKFISTGFINLLQIIKEQLEPVAFDKKIFKRVTGEIVKNVSNFKEVINKALEDDLKPSYKLKSRPGYEEYAIMIGNSGLRLAQYTGSLPECQNVEVKALGSIFIDILKKSNGCLVKFILKTCAPVVDQILTDVWYRENVVKRLIVTLDDFLSDYRVTMSEYSFISFVYELANAICDVYIRQFSRRRAKITESCGVCLQRDYIMIKKLFEKYGDDDIELALNLITKIVPLIESQSHNLFILELKSLKVDFPEIKKDFVKSLIKKRIDLNEDEKRKWIESIKELFKNENQEKN